jgi:hypothetical protein
MAKLRNIMVEGVEVAPPGCVVCHKPKPDGENVPGWAYLAGSVPVGAITCSGPCMQTAIRRFQRTGRVDTPDMRATETND